MTTIVSKYKKRRVLKNRTKPKEVFTYLGGEDEFGVDYKTYKSVFDECNKMVMDNMFNDMRPFYMPCNLGILSILSRKMDFNNGKLKIDYGYYRKTGKKIYHLNNHTNNYHNRFNWTKGAISGIMGYKIIMERKNKAMLGKISKEDKLIYPHKPY